MSLLSLMPLVMSNPWKMGTSVPRLKDVLDVLELEYVLSAVSPRPNDRFSLAPALSDGSLRPFAVLRSTSRCSTVRLLCLTVRLFFRA